MIRAIGIAAAFTASMATAQEVVVTSPCQPETSPVTAADMGAYLEGTWQMSAAGTGFTKGTNIMSVTLRYDAGKGALMMEGQGVSVPLIPIGLARNLGEAPAETPDFDASVEAMNPEGFSAEEIDLVMGGDCARPMRYWWTFGQGGNQSWGGLMFIEGQTASGFMANSAGGSRNVMLTR